MRLSCCRAQTFLPADLFHDFAAVTICRLQAGADARAFTQV